MSQLGDLWLLDRHRVSCGSALEESTYHTLMAQTQAAMVFTDPPYNVPIEGQASGLGRVVHREFVMASGELSEAEFTVFLTHTCRLLAQASVEGALLYVCMDWHHLRELHAAGRAAALALKNLCVWDKETGGMGSFYRSQHELILVWKSGTLSHQNHVQLGQYCRYRTNVWRYPGVHASWTGHCKPASRKRTNVSQPTQGSPRLETLSSSERASSRHTSQHNWTSS